jgi:cytochrome c peroxidase
MAFPQSNAYSAEKAELGRLLFFDRRLSADHSVACASCHSPQFAFTDGAAVSTGVGGQEGGRNAPTVINAAFMATQFWDGRAATLEEQALAPLINPIEMATTHQAVVAKLNNIGGYVDLFTRAFGSSTITIDQVAMAIATFERTIVSGNSAFDRYEAGDELALNASQIRGRALFEGKARCQSCHQLPLFTDQKFHNIGIEVRQLDRDLGRFAITGEPRDLGVFKTPTLRDIAATAPYMHDGSLATLEQVVDHYDRGGNPAVPNFSSRIQPLNLTPQEKKDLVAFLRALSGDGWRCISAPERFPE